MWRLAAARHDSLVVPTVRAAAALVRLSLPLAVTGIVANAQQRIAPLALGYLGTAEQVALFGAAQRFANLLKLLPQSAFAGALPVLAREIRTDRGERTRARFERSVTTFTLVSGGVLAALAPVVVQAAYGRSFAGAAPVVVWTAIGLVPALTNSARKLSLYAAGREGAATRWSAVALAAQAIGCALLIPGFAATGAAAAVAAGEAVVWWPLRRVDLVIEPLELARGPVGVMPQDPVAS
jgi:O-antigen/teichoic acid export membrane protein